MVIKRIKSKLSFILRHRIIKVRKSPNPIKWGVIGLGYMAETFARAIDGNKDGIVYAVASRDITKARRFATKHGHCKAFGSYESMVMNHDLNLDIIYIATPAKYHYEHIKLCLNAGKNVLCEKPITINHQQLEELIRLAKENNCFLMEGMWMKCLPTIKKAMEWIDCGEIGILNLIRIDFYKRSQIRQDLSIYNSDEGGGVLQDFGVYAIAFMTHFFKGLPEIKASFMRKSSYGIDSDWQIHASKAGVDAVVNISSNFGGLSKAAIIGNDGMIEWDSQFNRTNRICLYDKKGKLKEEYKVRYQFEGFEYEINEVQKCIRAGRFESQLVTLNDSMMTIYLVDQLIKNSKYDRTI